MPVDSPAYPVNLVVADRPCLVVGAGHVAAQKAAGLVECQARVHVIATQVGPEVAALDGVTFAERAWRPGDTEGFWLVIAATDDPATNRAVHDEAVARGIWVNSADDPANCTFTLPSRLRRGPLVVAVSTGGQSPAFATWLRRRIAADLGPEHDALLDILAEHRRELRAAGQATEGLDWQSAIDSGMLELVREGHLAEAKERLQACLSSPSA